jgi:DNA-binding XRE family transcriptional regulator
MDTKKRKRLEANGWSVSDVASFLKLTPEDGALAEMRLALSRALRERRVEAGLTQTALAKQLGSSQSRLAKLEAGDQCVTGTADPRIARRWREPKRGCAGTRPLSRDAGTFDDASERRDGGVRSPQMVGSRASHAESNGSRSAAGYTHRHG